MRAPLNKANLLVTGGAGFMGSAFIHCQLRNPFFQGKLIIIDALVHNMCKERLASFKEDERVYFYQGDIGDAALLEKIAKEHSFDYVVHFAAETHVDKSIHEPSLFVTSNIEKTVKLLEFIKQYPSCHFHHISTDEVFGSITEGSFSESDPYAPNSPYSASKAASDYFIRSFGKTYGLSYTISHACNNLGPMQYPEKLLPLMTLNMLENKPLPIYGKGNQAREWLDIDDHASAIALILEKGGTGESYNVGSGIEMTNLAIIKKLGELLEKRGLIAKGKTDELITFVEDRPGHDFRYKLNCNKLRSLGWEPKFLLEPSLERVIDSHLERKEGVDSDYEAWIKKQYSPKMEVMKEGI